jgi:ribulose 1,5-bisphosphate carboxylase large subunit-like protein
VRFTIVHSAKYAGVNITKYHLGEKYEELQSILSEWTKVYGKHMMRTGEADQIMSDVTFGSLNELYKKSTVIEQDGIRNVLLDLVAVGHFQNLIPLYHFTHEIPEDYQTTHIGMLGTLNDIRDVIDSFSGE